LPAILNGDDKLQSKFWHSYYSYVWERWRFGPMYTVDGNNVP
jgi:hypothetical protein